MVTYICEQNVVIETYKYQPINSECIALI